MNSKDKELFLKLENKGIIFKVLSGISFTIMGALIKYLSYSIPLGQVVFFRSSFALIPLLFFMFWQRSFPKSLKTKQIKGHLIRCGLGTVAMFTGFATIHYLPIAEATTLGYLSPLVLVIFAIVSIKEKVYIHNWIGVLLGILGLLIMTIPKFSMQSDIKTILGIGLGIITAVLIAGAMLEIKKLTLKKEKTATITFYFAISTTIVSFFTIFLGWVNATFNQWLCLIGIGILGGVAQLFMTISYSYAKASTLATYEYLTVLWALLIGIFFFDETPNIFFLIAIPLILLGAYIAKPKK